MNMVEKIKQEVEDTTIKFFFPASPKELQCLKKRRGTKI